MRGDGAIVLDLREEGHGYLVGDAQFVYPASHPEYGAVLRHVGGLQPGETKPVPLWPENSKH